jgi:iron(III) transport system substrate-binding protein
MGRPDARVRGGLSGQGSFKAETISASVIGMNQIKVQQMLDRVGYK